MSYADHILAAISRHLTTQRLRVANVLIGPKKEGWLNSEAFVAVNSDADLEADETVVFYGEQEYGTILKRSFGADKKSGSHPKKLVT